MKKITLLLLLVFIVETGFAKCASSNMQFYPRQTEISLNSIFIVEGYALSQKTITSFKHRKVYLESERGELVELHLVDILKGNKRLTQAIFKLTEELKPNTTYFLKYESQTEEESKELRRYNQEKSEWENVFWKTTDTNLMPDLNDNLNIEFEKTDVELYGCGPAVYGIFNINNNPNVEALYKVELIENYTKRKTIFYITAWEGALHVGHGMCAGGFTFIQKGNYKVRFTPMNTDGNVLETTDWQTFDSPFKDNQEGL